MRFIEIPVKVALRSEVDKNTELGLDTSNLYDEEIGHKINVDHIELYFPQDNYETTEIHLTSGDTIIAELNILDFEKLLKEPIEL